jgi:16S rRNA (cytidine1402-2'-O)-methyltransferase
VPRGTLYLVAVPADSVEDVTIRAIGVLQTVAVIACEETHAVKKLLDHLGVETEVAGLHAHDAPEALAKLCDRIDRGESAALITDPEKLALFGRAADLMKAAVSRGIRIVSLPGASTLQSVVAASGLPAETVLFLGSLPRTEAERREVLGPLRGKPYTLVLYETPRSLADTLRSLERSLGNRRAVVAKELDQPGESLLRDRLASLAGAFVDPPGGERVIVVVGPAEAPQDEKARVEEAARALLAGGMRPTDASKTIAGRFGLAKKDAYRTVMDLRERPRAPEWRGQQPLEDLLLERLRAYAESLQGLAPENMYGLIMPQLERPLIRVAMEIAGGRQVQAAEMLGIHRNTLRMKLRELGLDEREEPKEEST